MIGVGKIRFKESGRDYSFQSEGLKLKPGDTCVVKTDVGLKLGEVIVEPRKIEFESKCLKNINKAVRKATKGDIRRHEEIVKLEEDAFKICESKIEERELPMKLVRVEAVFDKSKILFYFRSETRVDFRELVKDLAHQFRTRIELRQIGVRDEARIIGGMGCCGRTLCCSTFLKDFTPVSIKMAKKQGLALNPTKISGQCGRLMCCIQYEYATYAEADAKRKAEAKKAKDAQDAQAKDQAAGQGAKEGEQAAEGKPQSAEGRPRKSSSDRGRTSRGRGRSAGGKDQNAGGKNKSGESKERNSEGRGRNRGRRRNDRGRGRDGGGKGRNPEGRNPEGRNPEGRDKNAENKPAENKSGNSNAGKNEKKEQ
jgi:cell fate regulator YaaT (PSP1 superfamily)